MYLLYGELPIKAGATIAKDIEISPSSYANISLVLVGKAERAELHSSLSMHWLIATLTSCQARSLILVVLYDPVETETITKHSYALKFC